MSAKKDVSYNICPECGWRYHEDIGMSPLLVKGKYTKPICGICALTLMNQIHKAKLRRFTGDGAEACRQDALRWRRTHPGCAPEKKKAGPP